MKTNHFLNLVLMLTVLSFTACDKDDPEVHDEQEVITTLNYVLTPMGGGTTVNLSFVDLDGDGGNAPTITGGTLVPNQTYQGSLTLLNESETPTENITEEIEEEAEEHQFFFQTNVSGISFGYTDQDEDGRPVGLASTLSTVDAGSGTITVILRHEPNKSGSGVSDGEITSAGGETDIEVTFPIDVE